MVKVTRYKNGNIKTVSFTEKESNNALAMSYSPEERKPGFFWSIRDIPSFVAVLEYLMNEFKGKFYEDMHNIMLHGSIEAKKEGEVDSDKERLRYIG